MGMIKGVHHIAVKPTAEQYEKTVEFYTQLLGMEIKKSWGDPERPCLMVSCGDNTCMEILGSDSEIPAGGPLAHIAFATDKVDELIEKVREAGYQVTNEPADANLGGDTPIRIAFFYGPVNEHIELFWEK
ncbi:MAG: VOC family protein [Acutalibacter sp.]|jgi:glyoxylase I family protein|nr:VOC family protein [Acutalibacter sp.]